MKKIVFPVLAALLLSGCDIHETYETYEIVKEGTDMFVDYVTAKGNEWLNSGTEGQPGFYVYQEFTFPEVTTEVLEKGAVLVYLVDADGRDNILPKKFFGSVSKKWNTPVKNIILHGKAGYLQRNDNNLESM